MAIEDPVPLPGYTELYGRSFLPQYDYGCEGSLLSGSYLRKVPLLVR